MAPTDAGTAPSGRNAVVAGRWGVLQQYAESDGVVLEQDEGVLSGTGCSGYLAPEGTPEPIRQDCGAVSGSVDQRHVRFQFSVDFGGGATFAADAYVSADGRRMGGRFLTALGKGPALGGPGWLSEPTAWGRLEPSESWFARRQWPADLAEPWQRDGLGFDLALVEAPTNGPDFSSLAKYRIAQVDGGLASSLGAFLPNEISFSRGPSCETTTIVAGPVPETAPGLPVSLKLDIRFGTLTRVQAFMASGASYSFIATKRASY